MAQARQTRRAALSDILEPSRFRHAGSPYGAMLFLPFFHADQGPGAGADGLAGYFSAVFHVSELVERAFGRAGARGVALRLFADTLNEANKLIHERISGKGAAKIFLRKRGIQAITEINFAGKTWTLAYRPEAGFFEGQRRRESFFVMVSGILITGLVSSYLFFFETWRRQQTLRMLSLVDELTALYNRRGLSFLAEQLFRLSRRNKTGLALIAADLDYLKQINDRYGHQEGDRALKNAAAILKKSFRESDIAARTGGDEFAVLAIAADESRLPQLLVKLRENVEAHNRARKEPYRLGISAGYAYALPGEDTTLEALMAEADKALYEQKKARLPFE